MKIKKNDKIKVIEGKDKGKEGKVEKVIPKKNKVIVAGVNIIKKHIKARKGGEKGQKISVAAPFDISNVALVCPKCARETKVGHLVFENGEKHRICKKCKQVIENKTENKS